MTAESEQIAARWAAASEVFPIKRPGEFASTAITTAEGDVLTVTVTDAKGGGRREYRAQLVLVGEKRTTPVGPGAGTPGGSRPEPTNYQESE